VEVVSAVLHLGMSRIRAGAEASDGSTVLLSLHLSSVQLPAGPPRFASRGTSAVDPVASCKNRMLVGQPASNPDIVSLSHCSS